VELDVLGGRKSFSRTIPVNRRAAPPTPVAAPAAGE
jgi:hypothetical protein